MLYCTLAALTKPIKECDLTLYRVESSFSLGWSIKTPLPEFKAGEWVVCRGQVFSVLDVADDTAALLIHSWKTGAESTTGDEPLHALVKIKAPTFKYLDTVLKPSNQKGYVLG